MDENHQDKTGSKLLAIKDKGSVLSEEKTGMPKRESQWPTTPAKWIELLGTPLTILIAVSGLLWGVYQFNAQQQLTRQQEAANQQQVLDQQRQTTLDTYLDRMSDMLLTEHLLASKPDTDVRAIAVARTLTAVRNLDGARKGTLIRFLWAARLINGPQPIISLLSADLRGAIFTNANLIGVNLSNARLSGADLSGAELSGADLKGADLSNATLIGAKLNFALPSQVVGPLPLPANQSTKGDKGPARGSQGANQSEANLIRADLSGADLRGADLSGADLRGANLRDAKNITTKELEKQAKSLEGVTMPNRSIHP